MQVWNFVRTGKKKVNIPSVLVGINLAWANSEDLTFNKIKRKIGLKNALWLKPHLTAGFVGNEGKFNLSVYSSFTLNH